MKYAEKYGVSRASRKYNKSRSYIYFWKQRWDGSAASLAWQSRRPHSHPNQHTEAERKLIRDMRRRNPTLGMIELWHRLRQRGYTRCPESLFRVMRKMGLFPAEKPKKTYKSKPYKQMTYPGERVQVDVKVVPRKCIANPELRLFQYTAIDEFTRLRFLAAYPEQSAFSSANFLRRLKVWYMRAAASRRSVFRRTTALSLRTAFLAAIATYRRCLKRLPLSWAFGTSAFVRIPRAATARSSATAARIRNVFTPATLSILWMISQSSLPFTIVALTTYL